VQSSTRLRVEDFYFDWPCSPGSVRVGQQGISLTWPLRFISLLIHGALTVLVLPLWLGGARPALAADQDRQVSIAAPPQRIVSLAPSITEILYFLEAGDQVVGVTSFCNYPPEVQGKPRVGTYWEFNLEAILALKPDLVLAMAHQGEGAQNFSVLSHWRIPFYQGQADTLPDLFRLIRDLARLTGTLEVARRKLPPLENRVRTVENRVQHRPPPRVFLEIDAEPLITVGQTSIQGDLIRRAGGLNIAQDLKARYPVINLEEVLKAQPEVILFTGMAHSHALPRRLNFWGGWSMLPAVRHQRLFWVNPDLVDRPGPRLVEGLELLAAIFHPMGYP